MFTNFNFETKFIILEKHIFRVFVFQFDISREALFALVIRKKNNENPQNVTSRNEPNAQVKSIKVPGRRQKTLSISQQQHKIHCRGFKYCRSQLTNCITTENRTQKRSKLHEKDKIDPTRMKWSRKQKTWKRNPLFHFTCRYNKKFPSQCSVWSDNHSLVRHSLERILKWKKLKAYE